MKKGAKIENLANYFILPLIELGKSKFGDNNLVNCYISTDNRVICEVEDKDKIFPIIRRVPYYEADITTSDGRTFFIYKVTGALEKDIERFRRGKYSQMSEIAKARMKKYGYIDKFEGTQRLWKALNKDSTLREELEEKLGVSINPKAELLSEPKETNFLDLETLIKFVDETRR